MLRSDRRTFLGWLAALPFFPRRSEQQPVVEVRPSALYQQPDGRKNLVRVTVSGLSAPAARARVTDRRGALVGTAGLLPVGDHPALTGEVWVPLSEPSDFQVDIEVGRDRAARRRVRLTPPKRWTLYWLASIHTDVGATDLQENALEVHRKNLDAALARLAAHPDFRFTAECALHVISYVENRSPEAGDALLQAIRDGKIGWQALFANMLTGLLDHETYARLLLPAGRLARERGLTFASAEVSGVPGQLATFPTLLAASGVKYLATGAPADVGGGTYPQLYFWEGPDSSRVLHWRARGYGDATRFGFASGPDEMGRRLSDWLLSEPALLARDWPYDIGLLFGADAATNALMKEHMVANLEEYNRRYLFPRVISARAEDFFREAERRYGPRIPVRRGDVGGGLQWEDGAASKAAELAEFRRAQLVARAAEILTLWDGRLGERDRAINPPRHGATCCSSASTPGARKSACRNRRRARRSRSGRTSDATSRPAPPPPARCSTMVSCGSAKPRAPAADAWYSTPAHGIAPTSRGFPAARAGRLRMRGARSRASISTTAMRSPSSATCRRSATSR